jgi:hypothetical protein
VGPRVGPDGCGNSCLHRDLIPEPDKINRYRMGRGVSYEYVQRIFYGKLEGKI